MNAKLTIGRMAINVSRPILLGLITCFAVIGSLAMISLLGIAAYAGAQLTISAMPPVADVWGAFPHITIYAVACYSWIQASTAAVRMIGLMAYEARQRILAGGAA